MGGGSAYERDETPAIVSSAGLLNDILLQTVVLFSFFFSPTVVRAYRA